MSTTTAPTTLPPNVTPAGWWVLCGPPTAALAVYSAAYLPRWAAAMDAPISPWWLLLLAAACWAGGQVWAVRRFPGDIYGTPYELGARAMTAIASTAAGAWWVWTATATTPARGLPLLTLAALVGWVWWASLATRAPRAATALHEHRLAAAAQHAETGVAVWTRILADADLTDVAVTHVATTDAGVTLTCRPVGTGRRGITYQGFAGRAADLAVVIDAAFPDHDVRAIDVRPEAGAGASTFLLHVTLHRVLADAMPYVPDLVPRDAETAALLAYYENGGRADLQLYGVHYKFVGGTGSGKTVFANNVIGRSTAAHNGLVWLVGVNKLNVLAWPWLKPWLEGRTDRPLLDRVAGHHIDEALRALRDAYHETCLRNDELGETSVVQATAQRPGLQVILEEAARLLGRRETILCHNGERMNASALVAAIEEAGRSAGVSVFFLSQYGLFGAAGEWGSEIERNTTGRICGRTQQASDGMNTLQGMDGVDTTKLTDHTILIQPSTDVPRAMPAKAGLLDARHNPQLLDEIAVRQTAWRPAGLEPAHAALLGGPEVLGVDYRDRWNPARHPELYRLATSKGLTWPGTPPVGEPMVDGTRLDTLAAGNPTFRALLDAYDAGTLDPELLRMGHMMAGHPDPGDKPAEVAMPTGWDDDAFDVVAALTGGTPTMPAPSPPPAVESSGMFADAEASIARIEAMAADIVANPGRRRPAERGPELLVDAVAYCDGLNPPREFVPTGELARALGRIPSGIPEGQVMRAVVTFGRELAGLDEQLEPTQQRVGDGARPRGFLVADLRAALIRQSR